MYPDIADTTLTGLFIFFSIAKQLKLIGNKQVKLNAIDKVSYSCMYGPMTSNFERSQKKVFTYGSPEHLDPI